MDNLIAELDDFESYLIEKNYMEDNSGESYLVMFEYLESQGDFCVTRVRDNSLELEKKGIKECLKIIFETFMHEFSNPKEIAPLSILAKDIPVTEKAHFLINTLGKKGFENSINKYVSLMIFFKTAFVREPKEKVKIPNKKFSFRFSVSSLIPDEIEREITDALSKNIEETIIILEVRGTDNYEEYLNMKKNLESIVRNVIGDLISLDGILIEEELD